MNGRRIENDEQLQKACDWLVEKAKILDHPLLDEETKAQLMPKYDFVAQRVIEYRLGNEGKEEKPKIDLSGWID